MHVNMGFNPLRLGWADLSSSPGVPGARPNLPTTIVSHMARSAHGRSCEASVDLGAACAPMLLELMTATTSPGGASGVSGRGPGKLVEAPRLGESDKNGQMCNCSAARPLVGVAAAALHMDRAGLADIREAGVEHEVSAGRPRRTRRHFGILPF